MPDSLHFPNGDDVPAPGTTLAVAPGIHWVRMPLPFRLDHINLWLLEDGDGWAIVDCGIGGDKTKALWEQIFAGTLGGRPVTRVIVTHFHPDHMGLADWLVKRWGAAFFATRTEWLLARSLSGPGNDATGEAARRFYMRAGLPEDVIEILRARSGNYAKAVTSVPARLNRIKAGDTLRIGGRDWRVMIGQGHAPEHACLWCEADKILIAGDQVLPGISPNVSVWPAEPEADPLSDFLATIEAMSDLPDDALVLPSHGRPFHGLQQRNAVIAAHHKERLRECLDACRDQPKTVFRILPVLFRRDLDDQQMLFAVGEALAHLNHLVLQGKLIRTPDSHADHQEPVLFRTVQA